MAEAVVAAGGSAVAWEANQKADGQAEEAAGAAHLPQETVEEVQRLDQEAVDIQSHIIAVWAQQLVSQGTQGQSSDPHSHLDRRRRIHL